MMKQIEEIKNALESVDVSTARGRRTLHGRQINIEPYKGEVVNNAKERAEAYLALSNSLRNEVGGNNVGITDEELESVELIMEQLESLANRAWEQVVKNY